MDVVIPVVFPDYMIAVVERPISVDVIPWVDFDNFTIQKQKIPELGHAGVLFFNSAGVTKYFEYGRYDPPANRGKVRPLKLPNLVVKDGEPAEDSLRKVLHVIAVASGQGGRVQGVYIKVDGKYGAMLQYAQTRQKQNDNPKREPYSIVTNSCVHFAKSVVETAGVQTPWMIDPRPNSYIGEFRDQYPDVDYDSKTGKLVIER